MNIFGGKESNVPEVLARFDLVGLVFFTVLTTGALVYRLFKSVLRAWDEAKSAAKLSRMLI